MNVADLFKTAKRMGTGKPNLRAQQVRNSELYACFTFIELHPVFAKYCNRKDKASLTLTLGCPCSAADGRENCPIAGWAANLDPKSEPNVVRIV